MRAIVFFLLVAILLPACSAGADFTESTEPTPTPILGEPTAIPEPSGPSQTAEAERVPYVIERVVLATEVDDTGEPTEEVTILSEEQQDIILTVRVRGLEEGTRFQAIWFEDDQIIGQSDERISQVNGEVQWVPLAFRSVAQLNPAASHSVELVVNDRRVNSYAFRVGIGDPSDIVAEATLALGTDGGGLPVKPGETFDRFAPQIVLIVRISNLVDPTGMIFTSYWLRDDLPLAQSAPDGGQPQLAGEPPEQTGRQMTFTFVPAGPLLPGEYTVNLLMNGGEIASFPFTVAEDEVASATPSPSPASRATPSPTAAEVNLDDLFIAEDIDEDTGEPDSERVRVWETGAGEIVPLHVALEFSDLRIDNEVAFTININNTVIDRIDLPVAAFESGWLSTPVEFRAPDQPNDAVEYELIAYIDGTRARSTTILIESLPDEED